MLVRKEHSLLNAPAGNILTFDALADFETTYGAQLLGATVVGIRGNIVARNRSGVTASQLSPIAYGFMVTQPELADVAANHPNPAHASINNDRFASWLWIEEFFTVTAQGTPVAGATTPDWTRRDFNVRSKRQIRQLEETLVFALTVGVVTTNNHDIGVAYTVALALP